MTRTEPSAHQERRQRRSTRRWVLLFFLGITTLFLLPWILHPDAWAGGRGDEVVESWYLGWVPWALGHGQNPLVTHLLDHPGGVNVMWNTSLPLLGLLGAPVNWLWGPRIEYHVWLTIGIALSGYVAYLFMSRRTSLVPAVLCGVIYAFSPFMAVAAQGHLHEAFAVGPPLLLILFDDLLVRRSRRARSTGIRLGLVVAAQLLIGEELLATELVMAPLVLAILAALYWRHVGAHLATHLKALLGALAVAVPVAGLFSAVPLYFQFFGPLRVVGAVHLGDLGVTDLLNVIVPNAEYFTPHWAAQIAAHFTNAQTATYISLPGLALIGATLVALRRSRLVWWAVASMTVALVLSLGSHLHVDGRNTHVGLPGALIDRIPLLQSIQPARLSLYVFLFLGILVAVGLDAAWAGPARWRWPVVPAAAMTALTLAALSPRLPTPVLTHPIPSFFTSAALDRIPEGSTVLVAPWSVGNYSPTAGMDTAPMLWQQVALYHYAMPSGYARVPRPGGGPSLLAPDGGHVAEELVDAWVRGGGLNPADPLIRASTLQTLRSWNLAALIIGPMQNQPVAVQFFTTLLGRPPEHVGGVELWMGPIG